MEKCFIYCRYQHYELFSNSGNIVWSNWFKTAVCDSEDEANEMIKSLYAGAKETDKITGFKREYKIDNK